jgi:hypothetical protein
VLDDPVEHVNTASPALAEFLPVHSAVVPYVIDLERLPPILATDGAFNLAVRSKNLKR